MYIWSTSDPSSEDDDSSNSRSVKRVRIENYINDVVCKYTNTEFKSHFRLHRETAYKVIGK